MPAAFVGVKWTSDERFPICLLLHFKDAHNWNPRTWESYRWFQWRGPLRFSRIDRSLLDLTNQNLSFLWASMANEFTCILSSSILLNGWGGCFSPFRWVILREGLVELLSMISCLPIDWASFRLKQIDLKKLTFCFLSLKKIIFFFYLIHVKCNANCYLLLESNKMWKTSLYKTAPQLQAWQQ